MKKLILSLSFLILILAGCSTMVYKAETTYTIPKVSTIKGSEVTVETMKSGTYVIGSSPSEYSTGKETEFTTLLGGLYTAGKDFPAGTYDLIAVDGNGSATTHKDFGLVEFMGTEGGLYIETYDNYTFIEGEVLDLLDVSLKLVPQTEDTTIIEAGKYNLKAAEGNGYVSVNGGIDLRKSMGADSYDNFISSYDNYNFSKGDILEVSGVLIELNGKTLDTEKVEDINIKETIEYNPQTKLEICNTDITGTNQEVDCSDLKEYKALKDDVSTQIEE